MGSKTRAKLQKHQGLEIEANIVPSSFVLLLVRHLLLEAMHMFLVAKTPGS